MLQKPGELGSLSGTHRKARKNHLAKLPSDSACSPWHACPCTRPPGTYWHKLKRYNKQKCLWSSLSISFWSEGGVKAAEGSRTLHLQYKEHACPSAGEATGPEHSQWSWRRLWREEVQQVPFCRKALDRAPQERDGSRLLLIFTATWNDNLPNQERRLKQPLSWQGQKERAEQKTPAQSFRKQEPGQRKGQLGPGRERRPAREMGSRANRGDEALWSQPHRMMGGAQRVAQW